MEIDASSPEVSRCPHYRPCTLRWFAQASERLPCPPDFEKPCTWMDVAEEEERPPCDCLDDVAMEELSMEVMDIKDHMTEDATLVAINHGLQEAYQWFHF